MRALFLLCTAVTVLQVLDVSITAVSAVGETPTANPNGNVDPKKSGTPNPNALKNPSNSKPTPTTNPSDPVDNEPGTNPNDESTEAPKTFKESGKRVVSTLKKMATKRGVGIFNIFNGFLKKTDGALNVFGNFLRDRARGVQDVAKESLTTVGSFSDSSTRGAKHLLNSGRVIGTQVGIEMYSSLQKATRLGTGIAKIGGTALGTPLSIGEDVVDISNKVVKVPSRLSKMVTNGAIKPALGFFIPDSEEQPEEEEEEEKKTEEEEKKTEEPPKDPVKRAQPPQRVLSKKPAGSS